VTAYQFVQTNRGKYTVREMAVLLGVSRSTYYRWGIRTAEYRRCGVGRPYPGDTENASPRVGEELRRVYGKRVSRKKAARLMGEHKLNVRRRGTFILNHGGEVCENLLNREFGGEKGVSDPYTFT
jgi:transposase InsO family protein